MKQIPDGMATPSDDVSHLIAKPSPMKGDSKHPSPEELAKQGKKA